MEVNYFQLNSAEYSFRRGEAAGQRVALAQRRGATRTADRFHRRGERRLRHHLQNLRDKLDIKLSDDAAAQLAARPTLYETGFTLLPGKYVIKLLARDDETGRIGTYQAAIHHTEPESQVQRVPMSTVFRTRAWR